MIFQKILEILGNLNSVVYKICFVNFKKKMAQHTMTNLNTNKTSRKQEELIREGLQIVHYLCVSSLSSFLTMEEHGVIQNTKFITDRYCWRRDQGGVSENVQTTVCCRVEKFLANVSMRHVFLLMMRELLLNDNKDKYTITVGLR